MANKVIDSDLQVNGKIVLDPAITTGKIHASQVLQLEAVAIYLYLNSLSYIITSSAFYSHRHDKTLGMPGLPWDAVFANRFYVTDGTAAQFLKADGSLDENAYALQTDLNSVKNNAWKLDEANAEVSTVVIALQGDMSIFVAMDKAGINYQTSRNIYVDMSEADSTITDIFAGYENLPVGIRYHIFFGNTKHDCKIYWNDSKVESNIIPSLGITPAYPTAKCEFMRVTEEWTYADWEAKIENVSHIIDTGTASESDNSTLMNYMDNNKIAYTKTTNGALVNITALLAALTGGK